MTGREIVGLPAVIRYHSIHRWFAWRPVFTSERGWVWLRLIYRQFTSKVHADKRTTWIPCYWIEKPTDRPENRYVRTPTDEEVAAAIRALSGDGQ